MKDVHTEEEGVMSKVDMGEGYLSYSGRPQTLDNYCDILLPGNMAQKWA